MGDELAIEIKCTRQVQEKHLKGLRRLKEEGKVRRYCLLSRDPVARTVDDIRIWPYADFLEQLWAGNVFTK